MRRACALAGGRRCCGAGDGTGRGGGGRGSSGSGGGAVSRGAQARGGRRRGAGRRGGGAPARGGARRCERGRHAAAPGAGPGAAPGARSRRALSRASWGSPGRCGACLPATPASCRGCQAERGVHRTSTYSRAIRKLTNEDRVMGPTCARCTGDARSRRGRPRASRRTGVNSWLPGRAGVCRRAAGRAVRALLGALCARRARGRAAARGARAR